MNVAVVHDLPTGGALRVLAEWVKHTEADSVTIYTRDKSVHGFVDLADVPVIERPRICTGHGRAEAIGVAISLALATYEGARLAREIDATHHDSVFCFASRLTQAPDVLLGLRSPTLYYAPESLRIAYEPESKGCEIRGALRGIFARVGRAPFEGRRARLDRRFIKSARRVVTHSRFTRDELFSIYGIRSDVVSLGVDAKCFHPGNGRRESFVLSVGALQPLKGHSFVLRALGTLQRPRPRMVVVGDRGSEEEHLQREASTVGVDLEIRRNVPLAELISLYQKASVVACGQIREPFGLVPLEAMACGCPVVAVDEGGFRETITNGKTGLLVRRDASEFGAAIEHLLSSTSLAAALGRQGRVAVERNWRWEDTASGFDKLLRQVSEQQR
ncbi:MAG TPA: glycosyltransferase family 4 protein [Acidimicrobiales bacterium]|nr:glycosyltransferase family 4 protein [Acidimicrobiales bacterium]